MTGTIPDEAALRNWLVDYLVTTVGVDIDQVDVDQSLSELGVGSRDGVVLSGELAELLGKPVSPLELWQHPTINALAGFLMNRPSELVLDEPLTVDRNVADESIAVVGLGCRLPGGVSGPDSLWDFLREGNSSVGEVPPERWRPYEDGSPEGAAALARTTRWGSFLNDIEEFDAEFFHITAREAAKMDPQQRLLLEVAWEALEHAGIPATSLRRSQTGVYVGACVSEYGFLGSSDLPGVDAWSNTGGALSIIANRLSYFLDLRGPSVTVDTACSSSLVAIHLACQSLRAGESNMAIAAGVNLLMSPAVFHGFDQAAALSPTGQCHAFDASADGFVRGEGCGVAVLKRLSDALRDGDRVLAVVRGSAVNQDGRSNGLMAPNPAAQMAVLRSAYTNAGVPAHEVDYVEAHGTGTFLGDPIEARALGSVLGRGRSENSPLLVGALKSNIGHLEAAAGIAGFIKAVMAVDRGEIPANLNFNSPNPHIPFGQLRLKVVAEHQDWPLVMRARRAGVSSFGFGGTNAHVVIEQGPDSVITEQQPDSAVSTLIVSGISDDRIASTAEALAEWMSGAGADVGLADVAHTLNHHRSRHGKFATVCARDRVHAIAGLRALADGRPADGVVPAHDDECGSGTVFVYSGQGAHWAGMGMQLLKDEPAFAAAIDALEPVFNDQVGFSLKQVLAEGEEISGDARVQPVIMGLQLALTELWRSYEVMPDAVIGHSMGEVTAAVVAGALSVEDGLRVIAIRSKLMSRLAGQGAVALVKLTSEATEELIVDYPGLSLAGYVSPSQTVVAGLPGQIDSLIAELTGRNVFARRVNMEVASHTELMDPILEELHANLADVVPQQPTIPLISTVQVTSAPLLDANYWVSNLRQPVRMQQAIKTAAAVHTTFVEISAHPMLTNAVSDTLGDTHHHTMGTLWRDGDDTVSFHSNLNATHISQPPHLPHPAEPHVVLPTTPWHHARHWMDLTLPVRSAGSVGGGRVSAVGLGSVIPAEWNCELMWPPRPLTDEPDCVSGPWLVIGDGSIGRQIDRLLGEGSAVTVLAEDADQSALDDALRTAEHVLYAPAVRSPLDVDSAYRLFNSGRRLAMALAAADAPQKLIVLTRNAQPVFEGDRANPAHATLWGLGRTLALEQPEIWGGIVDIDESVPPVLAARYVLAEAGNPDGEDQIVYRAGTRRAPRLQRCTQAATSAAVLDQQSSYLVVGATGNIGPHLIQQLADMGAATVVAVSRNPGTRLQQLTETLSERGVTLVTVAADASDKTSMSALFERFGADLPPLGGVYLAAFGGGPITLSDMTESDVKAMFAPKLDAAVVLHELTLDLPLQQFVLFTSISGITGSRWLAHYTATTTFLDALVFARRAAGLSATAINWGLWKSLADSQSEEDRQVTLASGLEPLPDEVAIQALPLVTGPGAPVRSTIVAADWPQLAAVYRTRAALRIVDDLLPNADGDDDEGDTTSTRKTEFRTTLENCEPAGRYDLLADRVSELVASVMRLESVQLLDPSAGFFQFGMDSLMSVTLQRALAESLGQAMPSSVIFDYPTVDALTGYLATILPELIEAAEEEVGDEYDDFSEAELLQQLSERLSSGG